MKGCKIVIITISLVAVFATSILQSKEGTAVAAKGIFKSVNKLIKADWSNMGSWIFLYDPSIEEYESSVVLEIGFHRELEDMARGGGNAYVVEILIELVNSMFDKGIKLDQFSNNGKRLELVYQNRMWIVWDYANKKEPSEVIKG